MIKRSPLPSGAAVVLLLLLASCGSVHRSIDATPPPHGTRMARTELYFGLSRDDGSTISDREWQAFLAETITPRFSDGLTVLEGYGQWKEEGTIQREPSRVLIVIHEGTAARNASIEEIRSAYLKQFKQTSVLRVDSWVGASW